MEGEDGCSPGRPRTDPRSNSTGPDLEGVAPVASPAHDPAEPGSTAALSRTGLDDAVERVTRAALRPRPPGPVGLELEGHLVDLRRPAERVPWARIGAVVDALPPLPGGSRVTLEPGGQVELSGPPGDDVAAAVAALRADAAALRAGLAAERLGLALLGADPAAAGRTGQPRRAVRRHGGALRRRRLRRGRAWR